MAGQAIRRSHPHLKTSTPQPDNFCGLYPIFSRDFFRFFCFPLLRGCFWRLILKRRVYSNLLNERRNSQERNTYNTSQSLHKILTSVRRSPLCPCFLSAEMMHSQRRKRGCPQLDRVGAIFCVDEKKWVSWSCGGKPKGFHYDCKLCCSENKKDDCWLPKRINHHY